MPEPTPFPQAPLIAAAMQAIAEPTRQRLRTLADLADRLADQCCPACGRLADMRDDGLLCRSCDQ